MKRTLLSLSAGFLIACSYTSASEREVVVFEAGKTPLKNRMYCSNCGWIKGSDYRPVPKLVEFQGGKWLKFDYVGTGGTGRAVILLKDLLKKLPEDVTPRGIQLKVYCKGNDFRKLPVSLHFSDGNSVGKHLPLEKGLKDYYFETGWSRRKINPKDWRGLNSIVITLPSKKTPDFLLQKITIKLHERKTTVQKIKILKERKVQEILPGRGATQLTFNSGSPLQVRVGYDAQNLYIDTIARFPAKPTSTFKTGDKVGSVWGDELTEFFFDGWNDNRCYVQFVTNLNGAVWDSKTAFDKTAATVIRRFKDWSLPHTKKISFINNTWKIAGVFALKDFEVDLKRQFMAFQVAQGYEKKRGGAFKTTVWAPCERFPYPKNFGLLVFNKKRFGAGRIKVDNASVKKDMATGNADFVLNCSLSDFPAGEYLLRKYAAAPDNTFKELEQTRISLTSGPSNRNIVFPRLKSLDGLYTLYFGLVNKSGNMKLCAVNVENIVPLQDKFGQRIFCPDPKQIKWGKGAFLVGRHKVISVPANAGDRTLLTAQILRDKLLGYTGVKYRIVKGGDKGIMLAVNNAVVPAGIKKKLRVDGYKLEVTANKVKISGGGEAGLYYGCKTLLQMVKQPMKRTVESPIPAVTIVDYPDLPVRFVNLLHPWQFFGGKFKELRSIDYLIDWVDRYVAGSKMNVFICNIDSIIKYKRHPEFNSSNCLYSLDDLAKLAKHCRDNFIEFIPRWQIGGHASWWLLRVHPELKEPGYLHQADVSHPKHNKLVFDCFLDVIEATKCKYINVGGDEWWHSPDKGVKPSEFLPGGKTRSEAFLEFFQEAAKFGRKHHVKILTHEDMINPYHNGTRYDNYKIVDKLPKQDIIILPWACKDQGIKYFNKKGFTQWANPTGVWFPKKTVGMLDGFGLSVYTFFYSLPMTGPKVVVGYIANLLRGAEYAWNANTDKGETLTVAISSGKLPALVNMYSLNPNPAASPVVRPISLDKAFNSNFNILCGKVIPGTEITGLKDGISEIGNIPMTLKARDNNCVLIRQNANIKIPVNGKYSSLIFLHTVLTTDEFLKANYRKLLWRYWIYGRPAGDYYAVYQDGSRAILPLRMHDNIWKTAVNPLFRMSIGCRYVMPLKTKDGNNLFLYQWEWINPNPEKIITRIELTQTVVDFNLILFAVSGRNLGVK